MHKLYKYLYWDEKIPEKSRDRIKWRLRVAKRDKPCYVLSVNEAGDQLDIYHSFVLLQPCFHRQEKFIVGIAADYDGAIEILKQIVKECYEKNRNADLKTYLAERTE